MPYREITPEEEYELADKFARLYAALTAITHVYDVRTARSKVREYLQD